MLIKLLVEEYAKTLTLYVFVPISVYVNSTGPVAVFESPVPNL
jgi:hypothetical protein